MSNWTHVAGIIRVDALRFDESVPDFSEIIGNECLFESPKDVWIDMTHNPDKYLPMGSEGSLQMSVWANPEISDLSAYTISIFGDLRDHDSCDVIIDWVKDKCNHLCVRQAVITVQNELYGEKTWTFSEEEVNDTENI